MVNRLLGMIYVLMNKGTVKASELAERFEVSERTVYRDVETLSMAGIPVYAKKGRNGGICLTEQFVLNKLLVTEEEQRQILAGLESLSETGAQSDGEIREKLAEFFQVRAQSWVAIDFSDWSGYRKELYEQLRQAILTRRVTEFDYYGQNGEMSHRTVEPVQLVFKDYTWYLSAYCQKRRAMRLFKILRMKRFKMLEERFDAKAVRLAEEAVPSGMPEGNPEELPVISARISASEAYRVYDHFEEDEIQIDKDGDFLVKIKCKVDDWIYGKFLCYGDKAEILAPESIREEMRRITERLYRLYEPVSEDQEKIREQAP